MIGGENKNNDNGIYRGDYKLKNAVLEISEKGRKSISATWGTLELYADKENVNITFLHTEIGENMIRTYRVTLGLKTYFCDDKVKFIIMDELGHYNLTERKRYQMIHFYYKIMQRYHEMTGEKYDRKKILEEYNEWLMKQPQYVINGYWDDYEMYGTQIPIYAKIFLPGDDMREINRNPNTFHYPAY